MRLSTPIVQIMKREPVSIEATQSILDAIHILAQGSFHHLPVVDQKRLVGILSTVDILKLNGEALAGGDPARPALMAGRLRVADIMVKDVIPLSEHATVGDAAQLLSGGEFHAVPIMASNGCLVGIVTTTDLIAHMLAIPITPESPQASRARTQMLETVFEAAKTYLDSDMPNITREHLERAVQEACWAAEESA